MPADEFIIRVSDTKEKFILVEACSQDDLL